MSGWSVLDVYQGPGLFKKLMKFYISGAEVGLRKITLLCLYQVSVKAIAAIYFRSCYKRSASGSRGTGGR